MVQAVTGDPRSMNRRRLSARLSPWIEGMIRKTLMPVSLSTEQHLLLTELSSQELRTVLIGDSVAAASFLSIYLFHGMIDTWARIGSSVACSPRWPMPSPQRSGAVPCTAPYHSAILIDGMSLPLFNIEIMITGSRSGNGDTSPPLYFL
jgi:hypothetical protein